MKKSQLRKIIKEEILKENSPGFDTRTSGEALPTLKTVKAAYDAKNIKEDYEDWKEGNPSKPDGNNPSNKMIYDLLKEVKALVIKNKPWGKIDI